MITMNRSGYYDGKCIGGPKDGMLWVHYEPSAEIEGRKGTLGRYEYTKGWEDLKTGKHLGGKWIWRENKR